MHIKKYSSMDFFLKLKIMIHLSYKNEKDSLGGGSVENTYGRDLFLSLIFFIIKHIVLSVSRLLNEMNY